MSKYYNPKRTKNLFKPNPKKPYPLSRTRLELFLECPRCFYMDRRLGIGRPPGYPFSINSAIDLLLKKEFDINRVNGNPHPLIEKYGVDAKPVKREELSQWRYNFKGIRYLHEPSNFEVFGAIDDLWINSKNEYIVVDYKATATQNKITELNKDHHEGYKRQMEIYQWLLRGNGLKVSNTGYFVYANGKTDAKAFDAKLEFDVTLIAYNGNDSWIENALINAHKCLMKNNIPNSSQDCDWCNYNTEVNKVNN